MTGLSNALTNIIHTYGVKYTSITAEIDVLRLRIDPSAYLVACNQGYQTNHNPLADPNYYQKNNTVTIPASPSLKPQSPVSIPLSSNSNLSSTPSSFNPILISNPIKIPPPPIMPLPYINNVNNVNNNNQEKIYGSSPVSDSGTSVETEIISITDQLQKQSKSNSQEE